MMSIPVPDNIMTLEFHSGKYGPKPRAWGHVYLQIMELGGKVVQLYLHLIA